MNKNVKMVILGGVALYPKKAENAGVNLFI